MKGIFGFVVSSRDLSGPPALFWAVTGGAGLQALGFLNPFSSSLKPAFMVTLAELLNSHYTPLLKIHRAKICHAHMRCGTNWPIPK